MVKDYLTIPSMNNIDHGYFVNILGKDFPNSFFPLENFRKKQNVRIQFFVKLSGERSKMRFGSRSARFQPGSGTLYFDSGSGQKMRNHCVIL